MWGDIGTVFAHVCVCHFQNIWTFRGAAIYGYLYAQLIHGVYYVDAAEMKMNPLAKMKRQRYWCLWCYCRRWRTGHLLTLSLKNTINSIVIFFFPATIVCTRFVQWFSHSLRSGGAWKLSASYFHFNACSSSLSFCAVLCFGAAYIGAQHIANEQ